MSTTTEHESQAAGDLAEQVHGLEEHEADLERRTHSLELAGPLAVVLSLFALAIGMGALVVALGAKSDKTTVGPNMMQGATSPSTGMMSGAGAHGSFTPAM